MEFKDKLKELRINNNMSQRELAEKIFISRSAVAKWENGLTMPSDESIDRLCEIFNVEKEVLLKDREDQELHINKNRIITKNKRVILIMGIVIASLLISVSVYHTIRLINKTSYVQPEELIEAPEASLNGDLCSFAINNVDMHYYYQKANIRLNVIFTDNSISNTYIKKNIYDVSSQGKTNKYVFALTDKNLSIDNIYVNYYYLNSNNEFVSIENKNITKSFLEDNTPNYREVKTSTNDFVIPENNYRNLIEIKAKIGKYYYIYYFIIE